MSKGTQVDQFRTGQRVRFRTSVRHDWKPGGQKKMTTYDEYGSIVKLHLIAERAAGLCAVCRHRPLQPARLKGVWIADIDRVGAAGEGNEVAIRVE